MQFFYVQFSQKELLNWIYIWPRLFAKVEKMYQITLDQMTITSNQKSLFIKNIEMF